MDLHIDLEGDEPRRDAIYRQIRAAILDGRIREGESLPPTRELAQRLAVSRNTVSAAYDRLTAEGFLTGRVGAGTYVRAGSRRGGQPERTGTTALRAREEWDEIPPPNARFADQPEFDFRAGVPDVRLFPFDTWRRLLTQQLRESRPGTATYGDPRGFSDLRTAIARHVGVSRDVRADAENVVITSGAQQAVDLVARVLLRPGDRAAVEDPGYPPPRLLFGTLGVHVACVPVDDQGIVVDEIPDDCKLVYVTPSHQYPLGLSMSLARRLELIAWAQRHDAAIIEDDYDSEFRFTGRPLEPLHSLDSSGRVVYVGSFSKVLLPALRMGFLVAPESLRGALAKAKFVSDWQSAGPTQAALAEFIDEGGFAKHIRKMRREYQVRHDLLGSVIRRDFAGDLELVPSSAGLHLSAVLTGAERDGRAVVRQARERGVSLYSVRDFGVENQWDSGLVFGYGAIPASRIEAGLRRVREILDERGAPRGGFDDGTDPRRAPETHRR